MTWTERIAVFDTETTGINPLEARLVTAFVGLLDGSGELERGSDWLADPGVEIPEAAASVHGITTEMAREEGEPAAEVIRKIHASLDWIIRNRLPLVVYNAPFDLTLMSAEFARHGLPQLQYGPQIIDPLVIDKGVDKFRRGKRTLDLVAEHYGVELFDAHDASADAVAAGHVAQALAAKYPDEVGGALEDIYARQVDWAEAQAADFEAYMRREKDANFTAARGWPLRPLA